MNKIERLAYNLIKKNAPLKNLIVYLYQIPFLIKSFFRKKIITDLKFKKIDGFFGFHDRPSINTLGDVLIHRELEEFIDGIGTAELGFINIHDKNSSFNIITKTSTCNYQQGSLATWLTDDLIILNNYVNNEKQCQIFDKKRNLICSYPFHFFSASKCGRYISSLSFARFGQGLKGYGYSINYPHDEYEDSKFKIPNTNFGDLFVFDLHEKKVVLQFKISDLLTKSTNLLNDGYFYFSHSNFSLNSNFIYFLLRSSNNKLNTSQLIIANLHTNKVLIAPTQGMVSHLDWLSDNKIIAYCNCLGYQTDGYYTFEIKENNIIANQVTLENLNSDGHPSAISDCQFITDTYPDRSRFQHLIYVNLKNNSTKELAKIYSPLRFRGVQRTDLHPRVSRCKNFLTIDSSFQGKRTQLIMNIHEIIE
ncbi:MULTISPECIES: hypothetical protein [Proteus]|uniref:hypothetical protein n=1 Tax=Proteus TaxID=583 RepID=UPI001C600652|nr:hypothetical protein [Proteus terrae]